MWLQVARISYKVYYRNLKTKHTTTKNYKEKGGGVSVHPSGLVGMQFDICCSKIAVCAVLTYIGSLPNQLECFISTSSIVLNYVHAMIRLIILIKRIHMIVYGIFALSTS